MTQLQLRVNYIVELTTHPMLCWHQRHAVRVNSSDGLSDDLLGRAKTVHPASNPDGSVFLVQAQMLLDKAQAMRGIDAAV